VPSATNRSNLNLASLRPGLGVAQDYAKAVRWYRKAAEQGDAQAKLGFMYHEGQGVARANAPIIGLFFGCLQQIIILLLYRPLTVDLETAISA
jgi:TPR repeat protein